MEFPPRAISDYNKVLALNPGDGESWCYRGLSYEGKNTRLKVKARWNFHGGKTGANVRVVTAR